MPNQSLLYTGRVLACSQLHEMMHIARELCGGQICITPDKASFAHPETAPWLEKFYSVNEHWVAEDRRKLLAYARDLLNSDYAGHRLTFQLFAQSPPFAHLGAVYRNFDWDGPLDLVKTPRVCPTGCSAPWRADQVDRPGRGGGPHPRQALQHRRHLPRAEASPTIWRRRSSPRERCICAARSVRTWTPGRVSASVTWPPRRNAR